MNYYLLRNIMLVCLFQSGGSIGVERERLRVTNDCTSVVQERRQMAGYDGQYLYSFSSLASYTQRR